MTLCYIGFSYAADDVSAYGVFFLSASFPGVVCVTDSVPANTGADVADALQALIDANPNRTIYFPDGE